MSEPRRYNPSPVSETARLELQWKQFGYQMMVDMDCMLEAEFSVRRDDRVSFMMDQIMIGMKTKILTDNLPPESVEHSVDVVFHEPASTWQMWKRNNHGRWYTKGWLPWLLARRPVRTQVIKRRADCTIDLARFRSYPQAQYRASDYRLGRAVLMHSLGSPIWDFENLGGDYYKPVKSDEGGE